MFTLLGCHISSHRGYCPGDSRETETGTTALKGHKSSTSTGKEGEGGGPLLLSTGGELKSEKKWSLEK